MDYTLKTNWLPLQAATEVLAWNRVSQNEVYPLNQTYVSYGKKV